MTWSASLPGKNRRFIEPKFAKSAEREKALLHLSQKGMKERIPCALIQLHQIPLSYLLGPLMHS